MRAGFRALALTKTRPWIPGRADAVRGGAKGSAASVAHALGSWTAAKAGGFRPGGSAADAMGGA